MFDFLKRNKPPKDTQSVAFKRYMASMLNGRHVRYVLEREDNTDTVVGKDGFLCAHNEEFMVVANGKVLFRAKIDEFSAWEFLSLEGAYIQGYDMETGKDKTVLAYYKYHR